MRCAAYVAEDRLHRISDSGTQEVSALGRMWRMETEHRFANLDQMQAFADGVCADAGLSGVTVVAGKRAHTAYYRDRIIYIPTLASAPKADHYADGTTWAMRGLVLLHELAHHANVGSSEQHGHTFAYHLVRLVSGAYPVMGEMLAGMLSQEMS